MGARLAPGRLDGMNPHKAAGCGVAFFSIFLLFGLGFSAFFVLPAYQVFASRAWTRVPCEVLESGVATHAGDDGATYSVEVLYSYRLDGREYRSNRYQFLLGSSSGYEGKARIVEALPPGTRTTCWVDPDDPRQAVMTRRLTAEYLIGLLPLTFVAVGLGGIGVTLSRARKLRKRAAAGVPEWLPEQAATAALGSFEEGAASGPVTLEAKQGPIGKLLAVVFIALFWNGIVSVFVYVAWQGWREGSPDGCLNLFLVPFVLVGALLLVAVPYQLLALFNPRPRLTLTPGLIAVGGRAELTWSFRGLPSRIRRLRILLEGVEEADVTSGKEERTRQETFASFELLDSNRPQEITGGSRTVTIPADTMHSFEAPDHRILWTLKLQGEIRLWPDVVEELRVVVHPTPPEELA